MLGKQLLDLQVLMFVSSNFWISTRQCLFLTVYEVHCTISMEYYTSIFSQVKLLIFCSMAMLLVSKSRKSSQIRLLWPVLTLSSEVLDFTGNGIVLFALFSLFLMAGLFHIIRRVGDLKRPFREGMGMGYQCQLGVGKNRQNSFFFVWT